MINKNKIVLNVKIVIKKQKGNLAQYYLFGEKL